MGKLVEVLKPIEATTETAFQRAILRNGRTILGSHILWKEVTSDSTMLMVAANALSKQNVGISFSLL